ncbi:M6 family metalloprotease domain-containing protein [Inconstantimicrobium mannanitabidum]|uniref:Uncharacterized protein n=1 Tax=Inconstantimicrobium mannanitabidum TaxID=1604901 RepID=A0ACB5RHP7_9CLOT|nr:M6 family metalloprotease domain-containing protein [Clostridium sp. TW13]GKX68612.1 hypothetical protein rsdtw13_38700 [Clostridium sp. TW13]
MRLTNVEQTITQPNGEVIECYASGDEYFNWLHDADGYIIIQDDKTGYYSYAKHVDEKLAPSDNIVTEMAINNLGVVNAFNEAVKIEDIKVPYNIIKNKKLMYQDNPNPAPQQGTINNLVVFIRFSDDTPFSNSITVYEDMFNNSTTNYNSMYNYFKETSYNKLAVSSTFYPTTAPLTTVLSYQDSHPRAYYKPASATNPIGYTGMTDRADREHTLLENAVNSISSQVSPSLNIDADNDGKVDNVCFIVKGSPEGWNDLLWPHQWVLYTKDVFINGKRVWTYNFQLNDYLFAPAVGVGVLSHEMSHSIGYPDLYHYSQDELSPVSVWDLMERDLNPPQYSGAYMKFRYGTWIVGIPEITTPGSYTLNPLTSPTNNCYKIKSNLSATEYFVLEYRKRTSPFESSLPGSGLLVYRINTAVDGKGNAEGPPDEVYVYRPGGTTTENGDPENANLSSDVGRTSIGGADNPLFFSDGTDSGISISNVGSAGNTISFDVSFAVALSADLSITKVDSPDPVLVGENLKYELTVKNNGPDAAKNVVVTDTLSTDVEFVSVNSTKGTCSYSSGKVTCNIGDMNKLDTALITISVKPLKEGKITNTATVTSDTFDPNLSNNTATTVTTVKKVTVKLSTGAVAPDSEAKSLIIVVENKNSTEVRVLVAVKHFSDFHWQEEQEEAIIAPNSTRVLVSNKLRSLYEVVFDNVPEGVYFWTATRMECCSEPLVQSNFIAANTFRHTELIELADK